MSVSVLYYVSARDKGAEVKKELEKVSGETKKVLDKAKRLCYYNQADADKADARCTLKIEQCKKKAYAK